MIIEDYHNFSLEKCRALIKAYQENKDIYTRDLLLAKFDKYLAHVIYDLRKKYSYLRGEDLQGLYHTAVLGFYKAIEVFECTLPPEMIFFVVRSYVRNELDIFYAYKVKEQVCADIIVRFDDLELGHTDNEVKKFYKQISTNLLLSHPSLKLAEKTLLEGLYCQGFTRKELAKLSGFTEPTVALHLKNALKKLRKILKRTGELKDK